VLRFSGLKFHMRTFKVCFLSTALLMDTHCFPLTGGMAWPDDLGPGWRVLNKNGVILVGRPCTALKAGFCFDFVEATVVWRAPAAPCFLGLGAGRSNQCSPASKKIQFFLSAMDPHACETRRLPRSDSCRRRQRGSAITLFWWSTRFCLGAPTAGVLPLGICALIGGGTCRAWRCVFWYFGRAILPSSHPAQVSASRES